MGHNSTEDVKIILLGAPGSGKSRTGNCILGSEKSFDFRSSSEEPIKKESYHNKMKVTIVESPSGKTNKLEREECFEECLRLVEPGPHFFIFCCKMDRITDETNIFIKNFEVFFGKNIYNFMIIAFTHFDQWRDDMIELEKEPDTELYIKTLPSRMTHLLEKCNERFIFLDNRQTADMIQRQSSKLHQTMLEIMSNRKESEVIYQKNNDLWSTFCGHFCFR